MSGKNIRYFKNNRYLYRVTDHPAHKNYTEYYHKKLDKWSCVQHMGRFILKYAKPLTKDEAFLEMI